MKTLMNPGHKSDSGRPLLTAESSCLANNLAGVTALFREPLPAVRELVSPVFVLSLVQ